MPNYTRQKAWEDRRHWEELDQPPKWISLRMDSFDFGPDDSRYFILTGKTYHYRIRSIPRNGHMEIVVERSPRGRKGRLYDRKVVGISRPKGILARLFGRG